MNWLKIHQTKIQGAKEDCSRGLRTLQLFLSVADKSSSIKNSYGNSGQSRAYSEWYLFVLGRTSKFHLFCQYFDKFLHFWSTYSENKYPTTLMFYVPLSYKIRGATWETFLKRKERFYKNIERFLHLWTKVL